MKGEGRLNVEWAGWDAGINGGDEKCGGVCFADCGG